MGSTMTARGGVIMGAWPGRGIGGGCGPSSLGRGVRCVGSNAEDSLNSGNTTGIYWMKYRDPRIRSGKPFNRFRSRFHQIFSNFFS